jgi:hypothetical protein
VAVLAAALGSDERRRPRNPKAPADLTATGSCEGLLDSRIRLAWSMTASPFADGYEIYRSEISGGPYGRIGLVSARDRTSFIDHDTALGETYFYVVRSTSGKRSGAPSGQAQARAPIACVF